MAAVTICSDFGVQKNEVWHYFHCFPSISQEVVGPDAMIFVFWMLSFKPTFSLSTFTFIKGGGFRLATAVPYLPFFFFLVFPSQRVVVLPWGCTIKISQSKILRTVLSRWLCLRIGLCIGAPKTLFWRNTMDVLKTSFRRYMTSNYSSFFSFFWSQMAPFIV